MKKIVSLFASSAVVVSMMLGSCTKKLDEVFTNPNADVRRPVEELLPNIIANMTISNAVGSNYGTQNDMVYVGRYVQFWATNTTNNQYDRMGNQPITSAASILGAHWAAHYFGQGNNLNKMIEWAIEEKKWDYVGVGYAIRAWGWLTLTNMHGEVILHSAFKDQLTFPYDPQSEVYDEVRRVAHLALAYLNNTGDNASPANLAKGDAFMNGGDVEKWKKFVYVVLARSFNQLTNKSNYNADSVIHYINLANMGNEHNTKMRWNQQGGNAGHSFFAAFRGNFNTLRQTRFIAELMTGLNPALNSNEVDPRAPYIIRENTLGTYKGIRPTKGADGLPANEQPQGFNGQTFASTGNPADDLGSRFLFKNTAVFPIITAAEAQFIKAEALYRKGLKGAALDAYKLGINLHFDQLIADYEQFVPSNLRMTPGARAAYLANPAIVPVNGNDLTLSKIMLQKFIAMYGFGAIETWVDLRRYHYNLDTENGEPVYRNFEPPAPADLWPDNRFKVVQRAFPRGASEFYNLVEFHKIGGANIDYHTFEQWFSQQ